MAVWNLPVFAQGAAFPKAGDFGKWQLADTTLRRLSSSLKVDGNSFTDQHEPVRAIPDPWAQARVFGEALIAGEAVAGDWVHPLYDEAIAQWRGLLALFALRDLYAADYNLTPHRFNLDGDGLFDRVLSHLTPQVALDGNAELWRQPVIFKLNNHPIALGNPACLVSPGRLTPELKFDKIPWYQSGLKDPTKCGLPVTQLFLLSKWLHQLWHDLAPMKGEAADRLRLLILSYAKECDQQVGGDTKLSANLGSSLHKELGEPYSMLFATAVLEKNADPSETSSTKIKLNTDLDLGDLKGLILIDEALKHDKRFNPANTLVWGNRTLSELLASPELFKNTANEAAALGWMFVTGDDIFTPRVVRFANDARIAGNPQGLENMLAPLRPLSLLLPGGPQGRIGCRSGGGKAVFTLRLQIDDGTTHGHNFDFNRHYGLDPAAGEGLLVEDEHWRIYHTSVWPDFRSSAWQSYFARFNYTEQNSGYMVRPAHALSATLVAAEVADQSTASSAVSRLREVNSGSPLSANLDRWKHSERKVAAEYEDLQFSTTPFEAISYIDAFGDRRDAPAGLALIDLRNVEPIGGGVDVAVDFGTTNTVACFDDGEPVNFVDRLVYPLAFADARNSTESLFDYRWQVRKFFPPELRKTPTPTVALNRVPYPIQPGHHLFRNMIYFHSHEQHSRNTEAGDIASFKRVASQAMFNLKWTDNAEKAEASTDFLNQFVMMVAAEALGSGRDPRQIRWRFSIPDSLDGEMRLTFEDNLREMTSKISTGVISPSEVLRPLYSEGLAAAKYILDGGAGFTRGSLNLVLDIGGGTTDVTIWDLGPIQWIGSFKFAGQNFFTRAISQNPQILDPIGLGHWQALFEAGGSGDDGVSRKDMPHLAEMLFSGPELQNAIDDNWNSRLKLDTGKDLRLIAQTFIAGLSWYLGRTVRQLVTDERLREDQLDTVAFALCGRGAGLFKQMHAGRDADQESETTRALQLFSVAAGLSSEKRPQLFTTPDAKLEVVRGMISADGEDRAQAFDAERFCLSGLGVTFENEEVLTAGQKVSRSSLPAKIRSIDLTEIHAFLAALNDKAKIVIDIQEGRPQGAATAIEQAVRRNIINLTESKDVRHELEPPFIVAIRALVDIMTLPAAERDKKLRMEFRK
jgi:hypothetical protein